MMKFYIAIFIFLIDFTLATVRAEIVAVNSFSYFCYGNINKFVYSSDDIGFTVNGVFPADRNYQFGFSISGGIEFFGYAYLTERHFSRGKSLLSGYYIDDLTTSEMYNTKPGQKPTGLYAVHDVNNDGIGTYDTNTGIWALGPDDILYTAGDTIISSNKIEIDGIENNVGELPAWPPYPESGTYSLPLINLIIVPEPATLTLFGAGLGAFTYLKRK